MILIEGKCREQMKQEKQEEWKTLSVKQHVDYYLDKGMDKKEAMKQAAKDRGVSKRDIYQELLQEEQES